jgi:4'-phosphopantetheinyl transferase EntD
VPVPKQQLGPTRAAAVENLFPAGVVAFEIHGEASPSDLLPAERTCVSKAVEKRVRQFAGGRLCARAGLAVLGIRPTPILVAHDRCPIWPSHVVGSISHTENYCVAVVGLQRRFAAIGVDAEYSNGASASVSQLTMTRDERYEMAQLEAYDQDRLATLVFSAKEAFYKCQYPLTHAWLDFEEVRVKLTDQGFTLRVTTPAHPANNLKRRWTGGFLYTSSLAVTGVALPRSE